jgi:hypothetical protein
MSGPITVTATIKPAADKQDMVGNVNVVQQQCSAKDIINRGQFLNGFNDLANSLRYSTTDVLQYQLLESSNPGEYTYVSKCVVTLNRN